MILQIEDFKNKLQKLSLEIQKRPKFKLFCPLFVTQGGASRLSFALGKIQEIVIEIVNGG